MGRMRIKRIHTGLSVLALIVAGTLNLPAQSTANVEQESREPQLVILDTDIGDDIDDAFALALLLRSPEIKLLGISTAYGDTELRARLVDRYLQALGRTDIPVTAGAQTPHSNVFSQEAYASQAPEREHPGSIKFLLEQIRAHPGEITLIAIGPLTNLGIAIQRDPATFRQLKRVVMMGGSVYRGYDSGNPKEIDQSPSPEWNIRCDPEAAQALLASGVPVFMMPLDSTQIRLTQNQLGTILAHGSPVTDQLTLLYHQWTGADSWKMPTLYDPVAVTYAIRPELCPTQPIHLVVDEKGFTRPGPGKPNAQVCLKSDEGGFAEFLLGRLLNDATH
jgi:inosine-uridine nucleoside N-ribohydrolase